MKTIKSALSLIFLSIIGRQTALAQEAVASAGGNASGSGGSVSFTVGQVAYTSISGSSGTSNQGVQQPFEFFNLGTDDYKDVKLAMVAMPNPTTSYVSLKMSTLFSENLSVQLMDLNGRSLQNLKISETETSICMETLPPAIYMLVVTDNNKAIKSFKIIKNNP